MKTSRTALYLFSSIYCLTFNRSPIIAQQPSPQATRQTVDRPSPELASLLGRIEDAERELAAIKERMTAPLTDDARRALLERTGHLEHDVQQMNRELEAARRREPNSSPVDASEPSRCCEYTSIADVDVQLKGAAYCKWRSGNVDLQTMSGSSLVNRACYAETKVIQAQRRGDLAVELDNERGLLTKGTNEFCIQFRNARSNSPVDPGELQAEATMALHQIKAGCANGKPSQIDAKCDCTRVKSSLPGVRAIVKLSRMDATRYCARVDFPLAGVWTIAVRHNGSSGKGKAMFHATIN